MSEEVAWMSDPTHTGAQCHPSLQMLAMTLTLLLDSAQVQYPPPFAFSMAVLTFQESPAVKVRYPVLKNAKGFYGNWYLRPSIKFG